MQLTRLVAALDRELKVADWKDDSHNGLQVANGGRVTRVAAGVDATLPFFERAVAAGADLAICHHGLSWGDSLKRITGLNRRLLSYLLRHDLALWACHLPLDAHPRLGNNACLARGLGLRGLRPFGDYHGRPIGLRGALPEAETPAAFRRRVARFTGGEVRGLEFGRGAIRTVGVISGGAPSQVADAVAAGLDAYVTGESNLHAYNLAVQERIHVFFAGHYATERFGVRAVADWIRRRFGLPVSFVDLDIPY
jgi:dinuclear metal center YbgI/SA1388 family protein